MASPARYAGMHPALREGRTDALSASEVGGASGIMRGMNLPAFLSRAAQLARRWYLRVGVLLIIAYQVRGMRTCLPERYEPCKQDGDCAHLTCPERQDRICDYSGGCTCFNRCPAGYKWWTCRVHIDDPLCHPPPILVCPFDTDEHLFAKAIFNAGYVYGKGYGPGQIECHPGEDDDARYYPEQKDGGALCEADGP